MNLETEAFDYGRLCRGTFHEHLFRNRQKVAHDAGIQPKALWTDFHAVFDAYEDELTFLRGESPSQVLLYLSPLYPDIVDRMQLIAGAHLRARRTARVVFLGDLAADLASGEYPAVDTVLIPDFAPRDDVALRMSDKTRVSTYLIKHVIRSRRAILAADSLSRVGQVLGDQARTFVSDNTVTHVTMTGGL